MSGLLGVALSLLTIAAALMLEPAEALGLGGAALGGLARVALLLCMAALASLLGLLSPAWSLSRQAALWGSALAAAMVVAASMNGLAGLRPSPGTGMAGEIPVPTGTINLHESVFADDLDAPPIVAPGRDGRLVTPPGGRVELPPGLEQAQVVLMPARTMEIRAGAHGHFVTTVEIEHTPILVLIDTGATKVAMSYEDADKAGLKPYSLDFTVPVATANGIAKAAPVTLRRIELGNIVVRDVEAVVLPEGVFAGTLLGMSFLSRLGSFGIRDGVLVLEE